MEVGVGKKMNPDLKDLSKSWFLGKEEQGPDFRRDGSALK